MKNVRAHYRWMLAVLVLVQVAACRADTTTTKPADAWAKISVSIKEKAFTLDVADTDAKRQQGLMERKSLGADEGMIFVFDVPDYYSFWMHDTVIPLDLVYLDGDGKVVDIRPLKPKDETSVTPRSKAKYAIELNAGTCKALGLTIGNKIALPEKFGKTGDGKGQG